MEIKLELPADLFDESFRAEVFAARIREFAILELVRAKRMHEHEAGRMLGIERWELIERMKRAGIAPTEQVFDKLKGELDAAIDARRVPRKGEMNVSMQFLHTMLRVNDLNESLKFYCEGLGMKLIRKNDFPNGEFTLAFVGYGDERGHTVVELTHNWGKSNYQMGDAFGHLAIGCEDLYKTCNELKQKGVKVVREPGPMKFGGPDIAFIEDPNGYKIELIQQSTLATLDKMR